MRRVFLALFLAAVGTSAVAADNWSQSYAKGIASIQKSDWAAAAESMQKAIAAKPAEEIQARVGHQNIPYLPYYWLGVARLNLGDAAAAHEAFRNSESQGVVQKTTYYADLRASMARSEAQNRGSSSKENSEAKAAADRALARAMTKQIEASAAARQDNYRRALQLLQQAFDAKKSTAPGAMQNAARLGNEAADLFIAAAAEARSRRVASSAVGTVAAPTPAVPAQSAEVKVAPPPPVAVKEEPLPLNKVEPAGSDRAALKAVVEAPPKAATEKVKQAAVPPLRTAASSASLVDLEEAFREFSRGRTERAEQILDRYLNGNPRSADALMLRGCSRYTHAIQRNDQKMMALAADDFRSALRVRPHSKIDDRYFSPKLLRFFGEVKQGAVR